MGFAHPAFFAMSFVMNSRESDYFEVYQKKCDSRGDKKAPRPKLLPDLSEDPINGGSGGNAGESGNFIQFFNKWLQVWHFTNVFSPKN